MFNAKSKIVDGSIITVILGVTIVCVKQVLSYLFYRDMWYMMEFLIT